MGHRESEDLDFFSQHNFNPELLQSEIAKFGVLENTELSVGTVNTFCNGVKLQFLEYPYRLIGPQVSWKNMQLSSLLDIACTKLQTISMRGSKKDFIDLYFLLQTYSLQELFDALKKKYAGINYSITHIMKSLTFFADAEPQPMPRMHSLAAWDEIKQSVIKQVRAINF
ncbi:MAG: hypothetical protein A2632_00640 [Candidatus Pacebacteria bacterium RIFCSPHIGHO2_01_FULL_46_16]|nr:MAG: hypothetical protein A2632_00640 [Candidatus Pacebacteria bacterium RIFCSPHIGHO2_01_FULL_46_16]OGJ21704.1 MAG: hypothetical protein A3J60_03625 [Candidatus Pacebacteria bacterium RIFCSPHIGHO2_02_FULL_46_9]OGJ38786.1 MAG: hypothetical protein A3A82_03125 [Candidatus Pacebacteria bacterium RIFCSPLOWO2_01_FULL_47_12]